MTSTSLAIVGVAGFCCGLLNAVAGGGSLVLFPALYASGMPMLDANVTNSVAAWPGYLGGVLGFRSELQDQRRRLGMLGLATFVGSCLGCWLLLQLPARAFSHIVPVLVLFASALLPLQPWLQKKLGAGRRADEPKVDQTSTGSDALRPAIFACIFLAAIYGGYFGGALGVILLAALAWNLPDPLGRLNALKAGLSLVNGSVSLVIFAFFGPVHWVAAAVGAPASLAGGYAGAHLAKKIDDRWLRWGIAVYGAGISAYLAFR